MNDGVTTRAFLGWNRMVLFDCSHRKYNRRGYLLSVAYFENKWLAQVGKISTAILSGVSPFNADKDRQLRNEHPQR